MKKITYIIGGLITVLLIAGVIAYQMVFAFPTTLATQPAAGTFVLRNQATGELMRPAGAQAENGIAMELFTPRPWTCVAWQFHPQEGGAFVLKNVFSGKTFTASDTLHQASRSVVQTPLPVNPVLSPLYTFIQTGEEPTYRIENTAGLCLTADTKETNGSLKLTFSPWHSSNNQKWEILTAPGKLIGPTANL